jgi:hypothetical protein
MVCITCLIVALSLPISRGLYNIEVMNRNMVGFLTAVLFVSGIIVLNQELILPKIMGKSKRIYVSTTLNFVVLVLIPALLTIVVWANGELVVARSGSSADKILLFVLFSSIVYLLAEGISTGTRHLISFDENDRNPIIKDELDYDSGIRHCLTNMNLDYDHRLRQQMIKSSFMKFARNNIIPKQIQRGEFIRKKTQFKSFYEDVVDLYFSQLNEKYDWPEKERQPLNEFLSTSLMQSVIADDVINQLYKNIKDNWMKQKIAEQSIFSLVALLEFNYSGSDRDEIIKLVKEKKSIVNFFVDSEDKFVVKSVHYNRTRIFTAVFISYFDYLSKFQVPVLTRKDDSQILIQILDSLINKHIEKYNRTGVDEFFYTETNQSKVIPIQNYEQDKQFKNNVDVAIRQLMDSRALFTTKSPTDEGISSMLDLDGIIDMISKWDEWG